MKKPSLRILLFAFAAAGVLTFGARADAALVMTLDDGVNPLIIITDGGAGDMDVAVGSILFNDATAGFASNIIGATSTPIIGGPNSAEVDIVGFHAAGNGGSLLITVVETDMTLASIGGSQLNSAIGGTINGQGAVAHVADVDGGLATTVLGPFTDPAFAGTDSDSFIYGGGPFILTSVVKVDLTSGSASYNAFAQATVPEPATMAYLGLSLGALALRRRRRSA